MFKVPGIQQSVSVLLYRQAQVVSRLKVPRQALVAGVGVMVPLHGVMNLTRTD